MEGEGERGVLGDESCTPINGLKLPSDAGCSSACYFAQEIAEGLRLLSLATRRF